MVEAFISDPFQGEASSLDAFDEGDGGFGYFVIGSSFGSEFIDNGIGDGSDLLVSHLGVFVDGLASFFQDGMSDDPNGEDISGVGSILFPELNSMSAVIFVEFECSGVQGFHSSALVSG